MARKPNVMVLGPETLGGEDLLKVLRGSGYKVNPVFTHTQAYSHCLHGPPDLILCDVRKPEADGVSLARSLGRHNGTRNIPVVFFSSLSESEIKTHLERAGGGYYATQANTVDDLVADISLLIARKERPDLSSTGTLRAVRRYEPSRRAAPAAVSAPEREPGAGRASDSVSLPDVPSRREGSGRKGLNVHIQTLLDRAGDSINGLPEWDELEGLGGIALTPDPMTASHASSDAGHVAGTERSAAAAQSRSASGARKFSAQSFVRQPPSEGQEEDLEIEAQAPPEEEPSKPLAAPLAAVQKGGARRPHARPADSADSSLRPTSRPEPLQRPETRPEPPASERPVAPRQPASPLHRAVDDDGLRLSGEDVRELRQFVSAMTTTCLKLRELLDRIESREHQG